MEFPMARKPVIINAEAEITNPKFPKTFGTRKYSAKKRSANWNTQPNSNTGNSFMLYFNIGRRNSLSISNLMCLDATKVMSKPDTISLPNTALQRPQPKTSIVEVRARLVMMLMALNRRNCLFLPSFRKN